MTTLYQDIRGMLQSRLASVPGVPAIAYEGIPYTPVPGTPFCEPTFLPANGRPATMGDGHLVRHEGSFEVVLAYPTGSGTGTGEAMADTIKSYFKASDVLTLNGNNLRFRYAERRPVIEQTDWYRVPVSIGWYTFSTEY